MKSFPTQYEDDSAFSTTFSDLIFGLLFFFFILSLTIFFQRPDVKEVMKEENKLLRLLAEKKRQVEDLGKALSKTQSKLKTLAASSDEFNKAMKEREEKIARLEFHHNKMSEKYQQAVAEKRDLENRIQEMHPETVEKKSLSAEEERRRRAREKKRIEEMTRSIESKKERKMARELTESQADNQSLRRRNDLIRKSLFELRANTEKSRKALKDTKKLLKEEGLLDVLAEVARIEESTMPGGGQDGGKPSTDQNTDEEEALDVTNIHVKFYGPDNSDVEIKTGDKTTKADYAVKTALIEKLAQDVKDQYDKQTEGMSESSFYKYHPRFVVMNHPRTLYGQVENFLAQIRETLPVYIQEWRDEDEKSK